MRILIHGGFFSESSQSNETKHKKQQALLEILNQGKDFLKNHSALETAVYTAKLLEDNPLFNAGIGSQIQSDGKIRMSAALMDGVNQKFSGVINIEDIQNPVLIAQKLMKEEDRVLGGIGATNYAKDAGFPMFSTETAERRHEFLTKKQSLGTGTIGCVVQDRKGRLAAATSTGGKGFEIPGRISDSATIAGNYANEYCAISCTGVGEDIVSGGLATKIVTRVTDGMPLEKAFEKSFNELKPYDGFAGAIGVTKKGEIFYQESHPKIVFAAFNGETDIVFT
ncbi:isoaspartyl peptidase/L-asparaginase [Crocinitomicaceae bacterium]|jgi:L-asparaginase|nr:isoaspartyl peptidase/L-asparaginase [Crocinitomicaceae bacterium]